MSGNEMSCQSKGLISLMNLLSTYEHEQGNVSIANDVRQQQHCIDRHDHDHESSKNDSNKENKIIPVSTNTNTAYSSSTNKRYVWDDETMLNLPSAAAAVYNTHGANLSPNKTNTNMNINMNTNTNATTRTSSMNVNIQSINTKLKTMQQELKKKTNHVNELKTTLARKKLANERNASKLKVECLEKTTKLKEDFEKKRTTLKEMNQKNESTIAELRRNKTKLHNNVQKLIHNSPNLLTELESDGAGTLEKEMLKWKAEEKAQLNKIAKEKSAEMKLKSGKALEPELRKLVDRHTEHKCKVRKQIEVELSSMQQSIERDLEIKLQMEMQCIDREEEVALLALDERYKEKVSDLATELEEKRRTMAEIAKKEKEGIMISFQIQMDEDKRQHRKTSSNWEKECVNEVKSARQSMDEKIKNVKNNNSLQIEALEKKLRNEIGTWKTDNEISIREKFENLIKAEEEKIRTKCESEVTMIKEKLAGNLREKKQQMLKQFQSELKLIIDHHEMNFHEHLQKSKSIKAAFDESKDEENHRRDELKLTRARLTSFLEDLHEIEAKEKMERKLNEETLKNIEICRTREKHQVQKALTETKCILEEVQKELQLTQCKHEGHQRILKIEMETLAQMNEEELTEAQSRIDQVISNRNDALNEKSALLSTLKSKVEKMDSKLSEMRKANLLVHR